MKINSLHSQVVLIMDIPTPYRTHLFNLLDIELRKNGLELFVLFMNEKMPNRNWDINFSDLRFNYKIYRSVSLKYNDFILHFNVRMLADFLLLNNVSTVIIGGSWNSPTSAILILISWLKKISKILFWAEANRYSSSVNNFYVNLIRKFLMKFVNGFVVPGKEARVTIENNWGISNKPYYNLTNIICEDLYIKNNNTITLPSEILKIIEGNCWQRKYFVSARLFEKDKGVFNFIKTIEKDIPEDQVIIICGDGEDRTLILDHLKKSLNKNIFLVGWVNPDLIPLLYSKMDIFVLPSYRDPYPLSAIEALWSGMPLMLSKYCGNYSEVLVEGVNGFSFDPRDVSNTRKAFKNFAKMSIFDLSKMKEMSLEIARTNFDSKKVVNNFVNRLMR